MGLEGCERRTTAVVEFPRRLVRDNMHEHFVAPYLDGRHRPSTYQVVSIVTAFAVVVAHNYPFRDPTPSREDREITQRLAQAGALLGVSLLDSVVFTRRVRLTPRARGVALRSGLRSLVRGSLHRALATDCESADATAQHAARAHRIEFHLRCCVPV